MSENIITIEYLEKFYRKNEKRIRLKKPITEYDAYLTAAAGYALDIISVSRRTPKHKLDLTVDTGDNLVYALTVCGMATNKERDFSYERWFEDLVNKAASYEMFITYNYLAADEDVVREILLPEGGSELVLHAQNVKSGAEATINFYDAYRRTTNMDKPVFLLNEDGMVGVYSGLASSIILKEFYIPLGYCPDSK